MKKEREFDPNIPFVRVLARWSLLDQSQRLAWELKLHEVAFARIPNESEAFIAPSFLASNRSNTRRCLFLASEGK